MTRTARPIDPTPHRTAPSTGAGTHVAAHDALHAVRLVVLLALVAGLFLPTLAGRQAQAQDGGQATIVVTSYQEDGETPLPFARFQVTDSLGNVYPAREAAPPDGVATLTVDVIDDSVTYSVAEETPPACGIAPEPQVVEQLAAGETEELSFSTSFEEDCDLGTISIYSYTCPDGLDLTVTDYAQYRDNCLVTNDGAKFTISPADAEGDDEGFQITTGEFGIPGRAPLVGLVPGDYLLTEQDNDSNLASMIYCLEFAGIPGDGSAALGVEQELPNADGEVELALDGGRLACDVFRVVGNLPANTGGGESDDGEQAESDDPSSDDDIEDLPTGDGSDDGEIDEGDDTGAEGVDDPASIEFHVATCPTGYDGPDYFNTCSDAGEEGISFTVYRDGVAYGDPSEPSSQPVDPGFAITTIDELPAGTYAMNDDLLSSSVFVYCADVPGGGPRIQTQGAENGAFSIDLAAGQDVICDWYLLPSDDQNTGTGILRLTTFACEPGYGGTSFGDVTSDCVEPVEDIAFNLASDAAGYDIDETTNGDGKIRFLDLPPGDDYVLDEDLPGDVLDDRIAFCAFDGAPYIEYDASTGTIQLDAVADGQEVQCLWYIVPTDQDPEPVSTATATLEPTADATAEPTATQEPREPGTLRIHKSECPPGQREDFYDACYDDVVGGIGFNVDGPSGYDQTGTTSDQGIVTFADVPAGDLVVTELQPGGYQVDLYVVVCSRDGQFFATTYDDSSGLRVLIDLPAGADIVCDWYNVPPGPPPTATPQPNVGSITVVVGLCELEVEDVISFADDCDPYGDGADFTLTNVSGGASKTGTTGTDSRAVFSDLAGGAYALEETSLDWCKAQADNVDVDGNVMVTKGANTNVYIYNCLPGGKPDPGQPGGSKTAIKTLPSTGTGGPANATVQQGISLATWGLAALVAASILGMAAVTPSVVRRRREQEDG